MVGVFDSSSLLNGFIDPNNNLFAVYSTNVPNFVNRGTDLVTAVDGTTNDMGPSVYTNGVVVAKGNITSTTGNVVATAGNVVATAGNVVAGAQIRSSTLTPLSVTSTNQASNIDVSLGQIFRITYTGVSTGGWTASVNATNTTLTGSLVYLILVNATTGSPAGNVVVTIGNNMRETAGVTVAPTTNTTCTVTFICDGTNLVEISRAVNVLPG